MQHNKRKSSDMYLCTLGEQFSLMSPAAGGCAKSIWWGTRLWITIHFKLRVCSKACYVEWFKLFSVGTQSQMAVPQNYNLKFQITVAVVKQYKMTTEEILITCHISATRECGEIYTVLIKKSPNAQEDIKHKQQIQLWSCDFRSS